MSKLTNENIQVDLAIPLQSSKLMAAKWDKKDLCTCKNVMADKMSFWNPSVSPTMRSSLAKKLSELKPNCSGSRVLSFQARTRFSIAWNP